MTSSYDSASGRRNASNAAALRSTSRRVGTPSAAAASTFFSEFSSVPVRNRISSPRPR
jgi:uncharacterized protein with LGFP repeats